MPDDILSTLEERGYATISSAVDASRVAAARRDLESILDDTPFGRDEFEGRKTRRVYALFAKTRTLDTLAVHPGVLGVLDRVLGHYQLSAPTGIAIGPGEVAQPLHPDDAIYPVARPHPELVVNVMWPLQDFTSDNGATRVVPGSHRWVDQRPGTDTETETIEVLAGDALVYLGSLWHGGGANRSDRTRLGVVMHYSAGWLRPVENHVLAVGPDTARHLPARLQELLGYNIHPPFIGYVDGRHPRKLLSCANERVRVSSGSPYEPSIGFSRAVREGDRVLVSGTGPVWPDGGCPKSAEQQALRCFEIVGEALEQVGACTADVVRTRMFVTSPDVADEVGRAHRRAFGETRPAATMVVVAGLVDPRWKVEVEAEAVVRRGAGGRRG